MDIVPNKKTLLKSWEKYGLIVVGNIVFFALLYFISYRPHNENSRAAEFLSMAQQEETDRNYPSAKLLYEKVTNDYPSTDAAKTARNQLSKLKKKVQKKPAPQKTPEKPRLDIEHILDKTPAFYVATLLAENLDDNPTIQERMKAVIKRYLYIAINSDGVSLDKIKSQKGFKRKDLKERYFVPTAICTMKPDWMYDDFYIKNTSIFPWHNLNATVKIKQGDREVVKKIKVALLRPGQTVEVDSFRIKNNSGTASCSGSIKTREGSSRFNTTF